MKTSYKAIIYLSIILLLFLTIQIVSADTFSTKIYPQDDGWFDINGVKDNTSTTMESSFDDDDVLKTSYLIFNISSIPPTSNITQVAFYCTIDNVDDSNGKPNKARLYTIDNNTVDRYDCLHGKVIYSFVANPPDNPTYVWIQDYLNTTVALGSVSAWYKPQYVRSSIEDNLSRGWWGFGTWIKETNKAEDGSQTIYTVEATSTQRPYLWVEYTMNAPVINNSQAVPLNNAQHIDLKPQISTTVNSTGGENMHINISWYNDTLGDWELIDEQHGTNGTYTYWFLNATEPCTTYQYMVEVCDVNGNYTAEIYQFTTHCINPPTSISCSRNSSTSINITFTPKPDNNGTTYTYIRYKHGAYPPTSTDDGTFVVNTTKDYAVVSGLVQGQCYTFSFWTQWNDTSIYRESDAYASKGCCCAGSDYWIFFFDEISGQTWNLRDKEPGNRTVHKLIVHYWDKTEDAFFIGNSTNAPYVPEPYTPTAWPELLVEDGFCFINISATQDVWYFELIWNYATNTSMMHDGDRTYPTYIRKLTPYASTNRSITFGWGTEYRDSIDFYMANLSVYGALYYTYDGSSFNSSYSTTFENTVVNYEYMFSDITGKILTSPINDVFFSIYVKNMTGGYDFIHQEYMDSTLRINPALVYERDYVIAVNSTALSIPNLGLAPTSANLNPIVYIKNDAQLSDVININTSIEAEFSPYDTSFIVVTYHDWNLLTDDVWCRIYRNGSTLVYSQSLNANHKFFSYSGARNNKDTYYKILVTYNQSDTYLGETYYYQGTKTVLLTWSNISAVAEYTNIENLIVSFIGTSPNSVGWLTILSVFFSMIIMFTLIFIHPALGFLGGGISLIALTSFIAGFSAVVSTIGIALVILAIVILVSQEYRRQNR